ncbi:MAG: TetR/AcrR family transcriptional regulator, partial [Dehalococcoidia bacterium]
QSSHRLVGLCGLNVQSPAKALYLNLGKAHSLPMATDTRYLSPAQRRQRNRQEATQAILDVSREVMREDGVAALNLNEVARRLGMTTPAIYRYFAGKGAIYNELFSLAQQIFLTYVERSIGEGVGFWQAWTSVVKAQLEFAHDHPELFELGFGRPVPGFVPSEESMAVSQHVADQGEAVVRRGIDSGEIRTDLTLTQVRDLLFAVSTGLTVAHMANEPHLSPDQGRFGGLADNLISALRLAWGKHVP